MKKPILIIGLSMLLLIAMAVPAMAGDWDVGVAVDDWFQYELELVEWEGDDSAFPVAYSGLQAAHNGSTWVNYTITDITVGDNGDNVTFSVTTHWADDSETTETVVDNMTSSMTYMVIGANMAPGDVVRTQYWIRSINETITRDYNNSVTRDANVLNYTLNLGGSVYNYYYAWDLETGILVYSEFSGDLSSGVHYLATMEIVDSSVEELEIVPDLTGMLLLLTLMSITVPIALLHRRKKIGKVNI
jgi:hypothetical protein